MCGLLTACFGKAKPEGVRPIGESADQNKEKVQKSLKLLQEKLVVFENVKTNCIQAAEHIKVQSQNSEKQIKNVFQKLQQFLKDEEKARIKSLKTEEQLKSRLMKEKIYGLCREIPTLQQTIKAIEKELRADNTSFLERVQFTVQDPQLVSGALIDEVKHVGNLSFRVWDKMKEAVAYSPVILDPNTAHAEYTLSDDLTSVRCGKKQRLPDNPERFDHYGNILSSEGYRSGSHTWDVEVGENTTWDVGVLSDSFPRKGDRVGQLWCIGLIDGEYGAYSSPDDQQRNILSVNQKPLRIRVQLDFPKGRLSFSDPDSQTHLFTFTHEFCEGRVYPYIYSGDNLPVKVLPKKFSVVEEDNENLGQNEIFPLQGRRWAGSLFYMDTLTHDSLSRMSHNYESICASLQDSPTQEWLSSQDHPVELFQEEYPEFKHNKSAGSSAGSGYKTESVGSGSRHDAIGLGSSRHDGISPGGSRHDTISPGGSRHDTIGPGGSRHDTVGLGSSRHDGIGPGGSRHDTIGPGGSRHDTVGSRHDTKGSGSQHGTVGSGSRNDTIGSVGSVGSGSRQDTIDSGSRNTLDTTSSNPTDSSGGDG